MFYTKTTLNKGFLEFLVMTSAPMDGEIRERFKFQKNNNNQKQVSKVFVGKRGRGKMQTTGNFIFLCFNNNVCVRRQQYFGNRNSDFNLIKLIYFVFKMRIGHKKDFFISAMRFNFTVKYRFSKKY